MIDRLRSHLRSEKGFTLIELLVVIAIIAVLVVIVVVAINPVERINQGRDRAARSDVRATGTLISTCVTVSLGNNGAGLPACEDAGEVETIGEGNVPANTTVVDSDGLVNDAATDVCAFQQGRPGAGNVFVYRHSTGATEGPIAFVAADC